jgi:hypothetical protein
MTICAAREELSTLLYVTIYQYKMSQQLINPEIYNRILNTSAVKPA